MLLRSTLIYAPAILATRVSALLILIVATRLINIDEYGLLALVVSVGEMIDVAVTNWLRIALLRLGGKGDVTRGSLLLAARILLVSVGVALLVAIVASGVVVPERHADFAVAVGAYLFATSVNRFALTTLQMQQRHSAYSLFEFARAALQLGLPILAILVLPASFLTVSLATSAGALLAGLAAGAFAARRVVRGPSRFTWREFVWLGGPLILMALFGFGMTNFERVVLKIYYDAGSVAIFAAAYALARQPIDTLGNAVNMGAFPEIVSRFDSDGPHAAAQLLSNLMALLLSLVLPAAVLLVVLADPITELLLPGQYHGQFGLLFPLIAASVVCANVANFVYGTMILAHKQPRLLILTTVVGSIATASLSFLLIPSLANNGAALALAIGSAVNLVVCAVISERLTHIPLRWRDLAVPVLIAALSGLAATLALWSLPGETALLRLLGGGLAGGAVFLLANAGFRFRETTALLGQVQSRLRAVRG